MSSTIIESGSNDDDVYEANSYVGCRLAIINN